MSKRYANSAYNRHQGFPSIMPGAGTGKLINSRIPIYLAQRFHLEATQWETYPIWLGKVPANAANTVN